MTMAAAPVARGGGVLARSVRPLTGGSADYDLLLDRIGDARFVLLGEASHGTHEFYDERRRITRRLIEEKGFTAIAAEADWPDAYRANRYIRGHGDGDDELAALEEFERFPQWMWRNTVILELLADLVEWNATVPPERQAGFYGLDLYSMYSSIAAVIAYLDRVDPEAARRAQDRYDCLEFFQPDPQRYGMETSFGLSEPCEDEAIAQLTDLLRRAGDYARRDGKAARDEYFYAEQNARLIVHAEEYYRALFRGGRDNTWNLRDTHMADTLDALVTHLSHGAGQPAKIVVWAHNSHLGDARATEMGEARGELNLGQLTRQRHGRETFNVGFSTYTGTVTAASDWGAAAERKRVRPGMPGSFEALFHEAARDAGTPNFALDLRDPAVRDALREPRLERAIGVIYRPETERWSHYFHARLPEQFDSLLYFDQTRAVQPLERTPLWETGEPAETYPTGM